VSVNPWSRCGFGALVTVVSLAIGAAPALTLAQDPAVAPAGDEVPFNSRLGYDSRGGENADPAAAATTGEAPPEGAPPVDAPVGEPSAMDQVKAHLGAFLSSLAAGGGAPGPAGTPGEPMPGHPTYHAQLAELLFDATSPFHEKAVLGLLEVKPMDVADKKLRARIAQGYRHVAFETQAHQAEGVRGLVKWGGKFSAPLLIELLERNAAGGVMGSDDAIYAGLGEIATPEAAAAVVGRLLDGAAPSEAIWACLRQMGPVAEAALVAALPFESPEANQAAIGVLGEVGTKKSNAILRRAARSENESVATAALDALKAIADRTRAAAASESGAATSPPTATTATPPTAAAPAAAPATPSR
jgi:hypothetical protein